MERLQTIPTTKPSPPTSKQLTHHHQSYCSVCYEDGDVRLKECGICDFIACESCLKRYISDEPFVNCKCMNCGAVWNREHLIRVLGREYVETEYSNEVEDVLYDIEKRLFPRTLFEINREDSLRHLYIAKQRIETINNSLGTHIRKIAEIIIEIPANTVDESITWSVNQLVTNANWMQSQVPDLTKTLDRYNSAISVVENSRFEEDMLSCDRCNEVRVDSRTYVCGNCNMSTCRRCRKTLVTGVTGQYHVCDETIVASLELINRETKACPSCNTSITKIDGCDQMYCVSCKCTFTWSTLQVQQSGIGRVHNPYYYAALRHDGGTISIPREIGDVPCKLDINDIPHVRLQNASDMKSLIVSMDDLQKDNVDRYNSLAARDIDKRRVWRRAAAAQNQQSLRYHRRQLKEHHDDMTFEMERLERTNSLVVSMNDLLLELTDPIHLLSENGKLKSYSVTDDKTLWRVRKNAYKFMQIYNESIESLSRAYKRKSEMLRLLKYLNVDGYVSFAYLMLNYDPDDELCDANNPALESLVEATAFVSSYHKRGDEGGWRTIVWPVNEFIQMGHGGFLFHQI